jgi:uncharacterized protein
VICPVCRKPMIVVEHRQVELDYCTICQGVWFDLGELELFLASAGQGNASLIFNNLIASPELEKSHRQLKCPACNQGMKEAPIGQPPIRLDVCRRGDGLWFDGGELTQLLKQLSISPAPKDSSEEKIVDFLGDVFKESKSEK